MSELLRMTVDHQEITLDAYASGDIFLRIGAPPTDTILKLTAQEARIIGGSLLSAACAHPPHGAPQ